jgi:PAS domain-containing protein
MADAISPQALSDLIGSIYDCALDPSRWERTLADVMHALDCHRLALMLADLRQRRRLLLKTAGMEPCQIERLSKYAREADVILGEALASGHSSDEPYVASRHLSPAFIDTSPYFQEWVKPTGMIDTMQLVLMRAPMHLACLAAGRNERQGLITDREIELGKLLLPHLRRAVTISRVLDVHTITGARMAEALDALRCGVVLTNEHGTILHTNRAAEHMLDEGGSIQSARASYKPQLHQPHPSYAQPSPLRPETKHALAKLGWRSASPSPTRRPSWLTSCRSLGAISAPGCNPQPLRPCSSVRHRTRRRVRTPWPPPLV